MRIHNNAIQPIPPISPCYFPTCSPCSLGIWTCKIRVICNKEFVSRYNFEKPCSDPVGLVSNNRISMCTLNNAMRGRMTRRTASDFEGYWCCFRPRIKTGLLGNGPKNFLANGLRDCIGSKRVYKRTRCTRIML